MKIKFFDDTVDIEIVETHSADENNRTIRYGRVDDCMATGHDEFYPNVLLKPSKLDYLILPLKEDFMSLKSGTIYEKTMEYEHSETKQENLVNTPLFFFICNSTNYYHFLYDSVPYLTTYFNLKKKIPDLKLLMNYADSTKKCFFKFVTDTLSLLGVTMNDIIIHKPSNRYKTIYIGSSLTHDKAPNVPPRREVYSLFNKLTDKFNDDNEYPQHVYISRRTRIHNDLSNIGTNYTTRRELMNEDELVKYLRSKGVVEVFCENMSMLEKINLFYKAKTVVGSIGGGMCNLLFSTKQTQAISLVSPTFMDVNERFLFSMSSSSLLNLDISSFYENSNLKTGTRVYIKSMGDQIGEIHSYSGNNIYNISVRKKGTTGCDSTDNSNIIKLPDNQLEAIDSGLNSPWLIDMDRFIDTFESGSKYI